MTIDLSGLFLQQALLDAHIQSNHNLTYEGTRKRRILSALVELGELANETRCFKFWSLKGPSPQSKILDEYADGMHFFLSLGIDIGSEKRVYQVETPDRDLTDQFLETYRLISLFSDQPSIPSYEAAFHAFLSIAPLLGADESDLVVAYRTKLDINYKRQQEKY